MASSRDGSMDNTEPATVSNSMNTSQEVAGSVASSTALNIPPVGYSAPVKLPFRTKFPKGTSPITNEKTLQATQAIVKFLEQKGPELQPKGGSNNENVQAGRQQIWLVVTTKDLIYRRERDKPKSIEIPHPLLNPTTASALLIVKDSQSTYRNLLIPQSPTIRKIISLSKLQQKYNTFESHRQLRDSHDIILADERIIRSMRTTLGSSFLRNSSKLPVPVRISNSDGSPRRPESLLKAIKKAVEATYLHPTLSNSTNVRCGVPNVHTPEQLAENVLALVEHMITKQKAVHTGWNGVRAVYVKSTASPSFALYLAPKPSKEDEGNSNERERKASDIRQTAREERKKAKKLRKKGNGKGKETLNTSNSTSNGSISEAHPKPSQKKRRVNSEEGPEATQSESEGHPKNKKQKIVREKKKADDGKEKIVSPAAEVPVTPLAETPTPMQTKPPAVILSEAPAAPIKEVLVVEMVEKFTTGETETSALDLVMGIKRDKNDKTPQVEKEKGKEKEKEEEKEKEKGKEVGQEADQEERQEERQEKENATTPSVTKSKTGRPTKQASKKARGPEPSLGEHPIVEGDGKEKETEECQQEKKDEGKENEGGTQEVTHTPATDKNKGKSPAERRTTRKKQDEVLATPVRRSKRVNAAGKV